MVLRTIFEISSIVLIFLGLIHEEKLIRWENWVIRCFRSYLKKGIKKQQLVGKQATVGRKYNSAQRVHNQRPC